MLALQKYTFDLYREIEKPPASPAASIQRRPHLAATRDELRYLLISSAAPATSAWRPR